MASSSEVNNIIKLFEENKKNHFLNMFDDNNKGALAVMKFLFYNSEKSTCGELSSKLNVSTARIAVILKKLEENNYIKRKISDSDARITNVFLTNEGKNICLKKKEELYKKINLIIDKLGVDKIYELSDTITKINHIMKSEEKITGGILNDKNV